MEPAASLLLCPGRVCTALPTEVRVGTACGGDSVAGRSFPRGDSDPAHELFLPVWTAAQVSAVDSGSFGDELCGGPRDGGVAAVAGSGGDRAACGSWIMV